MRGMMYMADKRLGEKVALVTGSSRGIGRGIAIVFAKEGADVLVHYRTSKAAADEVVEYIRKIGGKAASLQTDAGDAEAIEGFIAQAWNTFGRIDILVNNAGIVLDVEFLKMSLETWRQTMSVNLEGAMLCSQSVANWRVRLRLSQELLAGSVGRL
jgi:3-oxoacyl-[acyl-carrier protein] reductase